MLDIIGLENFKGFKKLDGLKVKPITILCGVNSCGKSSILQNILLFKQTLESRNPKQMLLLNGRFVHLGTFNSITFEQRSENVVTLKFRFKIKTSDFFSRRNRLFSRILRELLPSETFSDKNAEHFLIITDLGGNQNTVVEKLISEGFVTNCHDNEID
jgi:predicted ATPase